MDHNKEGAMGNKHAAIEKIMNSKRI